MKRSLRRAAAAVVATVAVVVSALVPTAALALPDPAPADLTAQATLTKAASAETVQRGETFTYTLTVGCSSITDTGCRNAVLSDTVPAPFEVVTAVVGAGANTAAPPVISGNTVTVNWTTPLGDGATGIVGATTAVVQITARLPQNASYDFSGIPVLNDALIEGTNFADIDAQVDVTPVIPLDLATAPTKSFTPASLLAAPGAPVTANLTGSNTSNGTVDRLVVQDPVDPDAAPNPFEFAGFTAFGPVTPPPGATGTTYEVYLGDAWVAAPDGALPPGADRADVRGTRVTFTGRIPAQATATVALALALTDLAATQPDGTVVDNTVRSEVGLGAASESGQSAAQLTLRQNTITVDASKAFNPSLVVAGDSSTVTLGASNQSTIDIETLTITEPSTGAFPDAYAFGGITGPVSYPAGEVVGVVVYRLTDGSTQTVPFPGDTIPAPPTGPIAEVASFQVVFTGQILPGGETSIPFAVDTDPDAAGLPLTVPNEVGVTGQNLGVTGIDTAIDDLYIYDEVVESYIQKSIRPPQILAVPGQTVTVSLQGGLTERPNPPTTPTGTTGNAAQIVVQDPRDPIAGDEWWNAFDLTAVAQTPVPGGAELTIQYYDTTNGTWETFAGPVAGPTIYSGAVPAAVRAAAGGIRFVFDDTTGDGFAPGTDVAPNLTSTLRAAGRYEPGPPFSDVDPTIVRNCAQSGATSVSPGVADASAVLPDPCPPVELIPADPGTADLIDKTFGTSSSGGIKSVNARSGDTLPSTLSWSTGGYSGFDRMLISDVADPATTPVASSVYDAFDLTAIPAITPGTDPFIAYDAVTAVELWNGAAWVRAAQDPCPAACVGTFPGLTLTVAERTSTLGVRLTFVESPNRAAASEGNLDAPPVGSGVARSSGNSRPIVLTWQVRDTKRSDGTPALGTSTYNLGVPGVVRNTTRATGIPLTGSEITATAADDAILIDVPVTTTTDKVWSGGPLAIPDVPVPDDQLPLSRVTVTTRNTTPARVDRLVITDPAPESVAVPGRGPFDALRFERFASITVPGGATSTNVTLFCPDGSTPTYTRTQALNLTAATLPCDVTGVNVSYGGRIASNAAGVLTFDLRLRNEWRDGSGRVGIGDGPVLNRAQGVVADVDPLGACPPPPERDRYACDDGTASIQFLAPSFGVVAGKSVSPAQQKEDDFAPVTVRITGQPTGSTRTETMILEDSTATFWNAFDFVGMAPGWNLPAPLGLVQACYLDGGSFTVATVAGGTVGGTWTCQPDAGSTAAAAAFLAAAPGTAHGVRFQVWQPDRLGWTNPSAPVVSIPFRVERRAELRSGGPVPTTRADQLPAPGETEAGAVTDTADVESESVDISPGVSIPADDSAEALYRNLHLQAAIDVLKSPEGDVQPGVPIPFTLSFTNTGELPLADPLFRDRLPVDDAGPQLILDPDRDPAVPPWSFELTGDPPNPPTGTALPTDPESVTVEETPGVFTFRMPAGSVLEVGQTYTITIPLVLRPGVTADDELRNVAAVAVEVPLDACVPVYDTATGECQDDAIVSPLELPALSTIKSVKADNPVDIPGIPPVFSTANRIGCQGAADPEGFYRTPCVPVTLPGDTETWRFQVTNSGTLPLDRLVAMDNLPLPGDQGLIVLLPRGSQWPVTFVGGVELVGAPAGATLLTSYSTSSVPCIADLNPLRQQCVPGSWQPLTPSTPPSGVKSLKWTVLFNGDLFDPGESLSIRFQTRTTPVGVVQTDYPIAYNTVATGGSALSAARSVTVPATEGRRVGVSYPTGPISLEKRVTGEGAEFAPDAFTVQLACTIDGVPVPGLPEVTLIPDAEPTVVEGLPFGAACTATETAQGQTNWSSSSATVGGPEDEVGLITVTNVFDVAPLTITKVVDSDAVDAGGDPVAYGPFTFEVSCTFLGDEVYADGYGSENPMTADLVDGQAWVLEGLPTGRPSNGPDDPGTDGAACTVTETDTDGAASVELTAIGPDGTVTVAGTSIDVILKGETGITSTSTNFFGAGDLALQKVVEGPAGADFGGGPFTLRVLCVLDDDVVWDGDVVLGGDQPLSATVENIAAEASCTVTETDDGGATESVIDPDTVVIETDATVTVTATNTFEAGSITVVKTIDGEGAQRWGAGPFEVTLECVLDGEPVVVPGGSVRVLSSENDYTTVYEPLLVGLQCALSETDAGGATSTTVRDADGAPIELIDVGESDSPVSITNTFDIGSIVVTKTVSGGDAAAHRVDTFAVTATCAWNGAAIEIPGGATRALTTATPVTYADLPVGAECAVAESDPGTADAVAASPGDPVDASRALVTVAAGAAASITIDNRFDPPLPVTGGDLASALVAVVVGLLLLGGGALALAVSRRRRPA